ncbi:hypothetical protein AUP68_13814 [Ilyonectria robusta]
MAGTLFCKVFNRIPAPDEKPIHVALVGFDFQRSEPKPRPLSTSCSLQLPSNVQFLQVGIFELPSISDIRNLFGGSSNEKIAHVATFKAPGPPVVTPPGTAVPPNNHHEPVARTSKTSDPLDLNKGKQAVRMEVKCSFDGQLAKIDVKDSDRFCVAVSLLSNIEGNSFELTLKSARDSGNRASGRVRHRGNFSKSITIRKGESTDWIPFICAVTNEWHDVMTLLEQGWARLRERDSSGRSALPWIAGGGKAVITEKLVQLLQGEKESIDDQDSTGRTPLSWAAGNGHTQTVNILLHHKAHSEALDRSERTLLSWAAGNGHIEVVEVLLALPNIKPGLMDAEGRTPLSWAAEGGHTEVVSKLIEYATKGDGKEPWGRCGPGQEHPLYWAAKSNKSSCASWSAENNWTALAKILIESGMNVDAVQDGKTPLCVAAENGQAEVIKTLIKAKANRNYQVEGTKDTPLCLAADPERNGHEAVVALLDGGADPNIANSAGSTPIDIARHKLTIAKLAAMDKISKLSEKPDSKHRAIDKEFEATVVEFRYQSDGTFQPTFYETEVLLALENPHKTTGPSTSNPAFRWFHLPANNMVWVEVLISKLYEDLYLSRTLLKPDRWVRRQHHGSTSRHHARFMRPLCQTFASTQSSTRPPQQELGNNRENLVLFVRLNTFCSWLWLIKTQMPYLHWHMKDWWREDVKACQPQPQPQNANHTWNRSQKLLMAYLEAEHPIHIRRTLDQYYYHALDETAQRDDDQTVMRYLRQRKIQPGIITMVDQLWLWVIREGTEQPGTVISCFPYVDTSSIGSPGRRWHLPDPLTNVKLHMRDHPSAVQSASDLASLITAKCSRLCLDMSNTPRLLEYHSHPPGTLHSNTWKPPDFRQSSEHEPRSNSKGQELCSLQLTEVYNEAIINANQEEAARFKEFSKLKEEDASEIDKDIKLLVEMKDVLDELTIMSQLFDEQQQCIQTMSEFASSFDSDMSLHESLLRYKRDSNSILEESIHFPIDDNETDHSQDQSDQSTDEIVGLGTSLRQRTKSFREGEGNSSGTLLTKEVNTSMEAVTDMRGRAQAVHEALNLLIDLKLKHNSVIDTNEAIGQGRTMLIFTITTIAFLPASFLAAFLALNIREFKTDKQGDMGLGYVATIMFPISAVISGMLIWGAFKWNWARPR